jgi:hypothetical protein
MHLQLPFLLKGEREVFILTSGQYEVTELYFNLYVFREDMRK